MNDIFNSEYYKSCCGQDYSDADYWQSFFGKIARQIVEDIHPKVVLDAGCAWGYLVGALRDLGVEAYGIDISQYAISKVRDDIKPFCFTGSLVDPLPAIMPQWYDLITNIEILEHLHEEDSLVALNNICRYTDDIIFSSSPDDIVEQTHYNVQQAEYWSKNFAKEGFYKILDYKVDYIAPQAVRFSKQPFDVVRIVENYERTLRIVTGRLNTQRNQALAEKDNQIGLMNQALAEKDNQIGLMNQALA